MKNKQEKCQKCGKTESTMTASPTIKKYERILCFNCRNETMKNKQENWENDF